MNKIATVFIVEDDDEIEELYEIMLNLSGFGVIGTARNGEEAVQKFKSFNKKPDIILMDHRMPIKNGLEATKEILQLDKNSKIIFASADRSVKDDALSIGAIFFLEKPFRREIFIRCIKKALKLNSLIK